MFSKKKVFEIFFQAISNLLAYPEFLIGRGLNHKPYEMTSSKSGMESSRTSLVSRTHFEVLGLGMEASSPRKLPCPRLEDSTIFEQLKFRWKTPETLRKICKYLFFGLLKQRSKTFFAGKKILKTFFFGEHLRLCPWSLAWASRGSVLGLGLEIFLCPWPRALCPRLHL